MKKITLIFAAVLVLIALYFVFKKDESRVNNEITEEKSCSKEDAKEEKTYVKEVIPEKVERVEERLYEYVKAGNVDSLATLFRYPISRRYPMRDIADEKDFVKRYKEIFDEQFCNRIINEPYNWRPISWRGYAYGRGELWRLNEGCAITSVNYYSEYAEELCKKLVSEEYTIVHKDITMYAKKPEFAFKTKGGEWYGRVDNITPVGNADVQLALYNANTPIDSVPDYLYFGKELLDGNAPNIYYEFKGNNVSIIISELAICEIGTYPYSLRIEYDMYNNDTTESYDFDFVYWKDLVDGHKLLK